MKVVALKDHEYDGQKRSAGDVYEAEEKYVPLLKAMGHVKVSESPKPGHGQVSVVSPECEEAACPALEEMMAPAAEDSEKPKRRYRRRDMVPEA